MNSIHERTLSGTKRFPQAKSLSASKRRLSDDYAMDLGDLIRQKRTEKGLSQAELAKALGVDKSAVAQWELNSTRPKGKNMTALKLFLDITTEIEPAPSAPYRGKLVEDPDLIAWVEFLEVMPKEERRILAKHLLGNISSPDKAKEG